MFIPFQAQLMQQKNPTGNKILFITSGIVILLIAGVTSLYISPVPIKFSEIIKIIFSGPDSASGNQNALIIWQIRIPRLFLAILIGFALSGSGMVMQGLFRNPLADPFLLGVSAGAALGATMALHTVISFGLSDTVSIPVFAFLGAFVVTTIVYILAASRGYINVLKLLLVGISIGSLCSGLTSFLLITGESGLHRTLFWLMGSMSSASWSQIWFLLPAVVIGLFLVFYFARDMDTLLMGEDEASSLGVSVKQVQIITLFAATLLASAAVAAGGIIGFVGLVIPHMMRIIFGPKHRLLLIASIIAGGILMIIADLIARTIAAPAEIPIGIITTFVGVPFFLYLLFRRKTYHF